MAKTTVTDAHLDAHPHKKQSELVRVIKQLRKNKLAMAGLFIFVIECLLAALSPLIIPYSVTEMDFTAVFTGPSSAHLFGCDDMGRDIFSRILYGGRYSLTIGLVAVAFAVFFGIIIGAVAGYYGGQVDNIIMRLLDVIQAIPGMLLMIVISAVLGNGFFQTIVAMSVGTIPGIGLLTK